MRLWWSRLAGVGAAQMLMVALAWQLYALTGSALDLGLVGLLQFVPAALLALPAGHLVDRWHRARIVAGCMAVLAVVAALLGVASAGGCASRALLLGLSVVLGAVRAFQLPATQALTPLLVPPALLPRALAFSSGGLQAAIVAGPAIGGLVYGLSAPAVYALCLLLFALAAALTLAIRYEHAAPPREPVTLDTLLAGVRFLRAQPVLLGAIALDLFAVLLGGATALLPIIARDVLHTGPWGLGLLRAAPAAGALAMSLWLARFPVDRRAGARLLAAVAAYGAATLVFGLSTALWLSLLALAVAGAADMISVVVRQTLVQLETPDAMRGRVSAVNALFIGASNQLGEFRAGAMAAAIGAVGSVLVGGAGTLLVALAWRRAFPALAQRDALVAPRR
ncbi:MAG: MFS transporter [Burkholderiales bacterium]|nr:MFS transporter [Burkholderiales bacterium]